MPYSEAETKAYMNILVRTPRRMKTLASGLTDSKLKARPAKDAWSANEILAHLRCCADVWGKGIARMLDEDHPTWRHASPRGYLKKTNYLEIEFGDSLNAFASQRRALLKQLKDMPPNGWERSATLTGTTHTDQNVFRFVERMAMHEERHMDQFERTIATLPR